MKFKTPLFLFLLPTVVERERNVCISLKKKNSMIGTIHVLIYIYIYVFVLILVDNHVDMLKFALRRKPLIFISLSRLMAITFKCMHLYEHKCMLHMPLSFLNFTCGILLVWLMICLQNNLLYSIILLLNLDLFSSLIIRRCMLISPFLLCFVSGSRFPSLLRNGLSRVGVPSELLEFLFKWIDTQEEHPKIPEANGSISAIRSEAFFIPLYELFLTYGGIFRLTFGPKVWFFLYRC